MTLNIDTLKLDVHYDPKGKAPSAQKIQKIEAQLQAFMKESLASITFDVEEQGDEEETGSLRTIRIPDINLELPDINSSEFLISPHTYFLKHILPFFKQAFYKALLTAIDKSSTVTSEVDRNAESQQLWQIIDQVLNLGSGTDSYALNKNAVIKQAEMTFPKLIAFLKESPYSREIFKRRLLSPRVFSRLSGWLTENRKVEELLSSAFPDIDHGSFLKLLGSGIGSTKDRRLKIKDYLNLCVFAKSPESAKSKRLIEAAVKLMSIEIGEQSIPLAMRERLKDVLLWEQTSEWIRNLENWLNLVLYQGLKHSDINSLERLIASAHGAEVTLLDQTERGIQNTASGNSIQKHRSDQNDHIQAYSFNKTIKSYRNILKEIELLTVFKGSVIELWDLISNIYQSLTVENGEIGKDLELQIKSVLSQLSSMQPAMIGLDRKTKNNLINLANKTVEEIKSLKNDESENKLSTESKIEDSKGLESVLAKLEESFNVLVASPWLPLSIKKKWHSALISRIRKGEINADIFRSLKKDLMSWSSYLANDITASGNRELEVSTKERREIADSDSYVLRKLVELLSQYTTVIPSSSKFEKPATSLESSEYSLGNLYPVNGDQFIAILAIVSQVHIPVFAKSQLNQFILQPSSETALRLKNTLVSSIENAGTSGNTLEALDVPDRKAVKEDSIRSSNIGIYSAEKFIISKLDSVLNEFLTGLGLKGEGTNGNMEIKHDYDFSTLKILGQKVVNRLQLYTIINQLLAFIQKMSVDAPKPNNIFTETISSLTALKKDLQKLDRELIHEESTWWVPLLTSQTAQTLAKSLSNQSNLKAKSTVYPITALRHESSNTEPFSESVSTQTGQNHRENTDKEILDSIEDVLRSQSQQIKMFVLDSVPSDKNPMSSVMLINSIFEACKKIQALKLGQWSEPNADKGFQGLKGFKEALNTWAGTASSSLNIHFLKDSKLKFALGKQLTEAISFIKGVCFVPEWLPKHLSDLESKINEIMAMEAVWRKAQENLPKPLIQQATNQIASKPTENHHLIHQLIWGSDLEEAKELLRRQVDSPALQKSKGLVADYQKSVQRHIDSVPVKTLIHRVENDIESLVKEQSDAHAGLIGYDAGLVLIWPYLTEFFKRHQLLKEDPDTAEWTFNDENAQLKAHGLLTYMLDAKSNENSWPLTNVLLGLEPETFVEDDIPLTNDECKSANDLLRAVIANWPALKDMSINNFRELFLLREGEVQQTDGGYKVSIEKKTIDILLTKLPWGLGYISLPWLGKQLIEVDWPYGY